MKSEVFNGLALFVSFSSLLRVELDVNDELSYSNLVPVLRGLSPIVSTLCSGYTDGERECFIFVVNLWNYLASKTLFSAYTLLFASLCPTVETSINRKTDYRL